MVKMVSHGKHIAIIVQQLNKFNPENQSVEDFLNESAKMLQTLNMTEEKFVLDTLAGCIEYKSLLDVVVNAFFVRDGRYSLMSERNLYIVICYLATFQLEELGFQRFSRIVKSLDTVKMQKDPQSRVAHYSLFKGKPSDELLAVLINSDKVAEEPNYNKRERISRLREERTGTTLIACATTANRCGCAQPK